MISSLGVVRKYAGEIRIGGNFETAVGYLSDYFQNFGMVHNRTHVP